MSLRIENPRLPKRSLRYPYGSSLLCGVLFFMMGCGVIKKKPEDKPDELSVVGKEMPPEKAKEVLGEVGSNFAYGPGLGDAAVNLGAVVVFPPYIIYLLGNTALSLSGYEPVTVSSVLPEEQGRAWSEGWLRRWRGENIAPARSLKRSCERFSRMERLILLGRR
jgi:hypothetical protein